MNDNDFPVDHWLRWLTSGRDADDAELRRRTTELLTPLRDEILTAAAPRPTDTVLDVGTGDGLLGVGALRALGPEGTVLFNDLSEPVIENMRSLIEDMRPTARTRFHTGSVTELAGLDTDSLDVVLARSVLIYVDDIPAAFGAMNRVLRPSGKVVLWEPVRQLLSTNDAGDESFETLFGWHLPEHEHHARRVLQQYDTGSLRDLNVATLVAAAEQAGLHDIEVTATARSRTATPGDDTTVHGVLHAQPNPHSPTIADATHDALPRPEADAFLTALETAIRTGNGHNRHTGALLTASKTVHRGHQQGRTADATR